MKRVTTNRTERFTDCIGEMEAGIRKETSQNDMTVYASVKKNGQEVATASYSRKGGYLVVKLSPLTGLAAAEIRAILDKAGEWTEELCDEPDA